MKQFRITYIPAVYTGRYNMGMSPLYSSERAVSVVFTAEDTTDTRRQLDTYLHRIGVYHYITAGTVDEVTDDMPPAWPPAYT